MGNGDKRYICSFVKKLDDDTFMPQVVVVAAPNNIIARAILCERYGAKNEMIDDNRRQLNDQEGIKSIRLSETNTYVDERENQNDLDND